MKKIIIVLVMAIVGISAILYFSTWVGRIPELEYKYKKDETLYYVKEIKEQEWVLPDRVSIKEPVVENKYITVVNIKGMTVNGRYEIALGDVDIDKTGKLRVIEVEGAYNYPNVYNYSNMSKNGDIVITEEDMFLGSQPRFGEGEKRSWKKTIYNADRNLNIPVNYKIVRKKEEKYRIKTSWEEVIVDKEGNEYSNRLKGYSDFDVTAGKITSMKSYLEGRKNGKLYTKIDVRWTLMSKEEIFELGKLKKDWELVVPDGGEFDVSKDGKLVYRKELNGFPEPLYISNGDGSNSVKVVEEGVQPRRSPDGKMIAYTRGGRIVKEKNHITGTKRYVQYSELVAINLEDKKEELLYENIDCSKEYLWSPDSKWIGFYVQTGNKYFESEPMMVNVETKEVKKIERDNYPLWYIDIHFTDLDGKHVLMEDIGVCWSHDGRYIAVGKVGKYISGLFIISRETKEEDILIKVDPNEAYRPVCWSSDGKFILFKDENVEGIYRMSYNIYSLKEHKVIAEVIKEIANFSFLEFNWSYDGKYIYFRAEDNIPGTIKGIYRLIVPDEIAEKISKRIER